MTGTKGEAAPCQPGNPETEAGNNNKTAYAYGTLGRLTGVDTEYGGSFALPIQGFSANVTYGYEEYDWNTLSFHDAGGSLKTSMTDSTGTSR